MIFSVRLHKKIIRSHGRIIFLSIGLLIYNFLPAQTYFFDNYGPEQGLESSNIFSIIQTGNDYIWIGTKLGATRFDGINFINYTTEDGLAPKGVRNIFEDSSGNIWFGHIGGALTRYDGKKFESIFITDTLPNLDISSFIQDDNGHLWISTHGDGVYRIENPDAKKSRFEYTHYKGGRLGDRVFSSLLLSDGTIYFVTDLGIKKYKPEENSFQTYMPKGLDTYFAISVLFEDSKKNLWFGTYNGGLYKMDPKTLEFTFIDTKNGLAANWITNIIEDKSGNIWTGHWDNNYDKGGITRIDPNGKLKVFDKSNGLQDHKIYKLVCDKENNILIGTRDHGFCIFKGEQFISFTTFDGLINNQVSAITEDLDGQLWFGTNGGITVYNSEKEVFIHYNQTNNHISDQIRFLRRDPDGNIWIGTSDQGVIKYDYETHSFEYINAINSSFPQTAQGYSISTVYALETDDDYNVYVGTVEGLLWYHSKENTITEKRQVDGLPSNKITALYVDSKNTLWVGGEINGLSKKVGNNFERINIASGVTPTCISEDGDGNLWIGTEAHGVLCIRDSIIARYNIHEGMLSNQINFINVDDNNLIYAGTSRGLNKIFPAEKKIFTYTKKSGFTGIETKNNATFKDLKGNLWFGTANGVMRYNSRLYKHTGIEPLTHINQMKVHDEEVPMIPGLKLSPNQKKVRFYYSSICMTDPDAVRYRIMLEGFESDWMDVGTISSYGYSLSPGKYTFNLIARNNEGNWNKKPITFSFRVLAPVYQRAWFIITFVILLGFGIISYIKIRERNLVREKRNLEIKVKERTIALSKANEELAVRNKDITDSIKYAKRIQFAILPPEIPFNNTFILFKPKDIVSGDFFWLTTHEGKEFIAAVDCTGHGVPGAFMSFIGYTSLNKIVIEQNIHEPAEILNHLNEEVASTLHQKGEDIVNDGMDIALVCYDPNNMQLQYAGAFNPLLLIRDSEIIETKANRFAIGRSTGVENRFTNHVIEVKENDIIYLFTDGYSDQFGGRDGKKFKTGNFKELLISIQSKTVDEQRDMLDKTIEDWRGEFEQIDDMLIIGRKFV